ncbi:DegT/DnrJ/EryC1/StrS family aminotransferase [Bacteroides fragilis]
MKDLVKLIECNYDEVVPHIFVIRVGGGERDTVKEALAKEGIPTGMHYRPNHFLTLFAGNQDNVTLKHTDRVYEELVTLPLHPGLTEEQINFICDVIERTLQS